MRSAWRGSLVGAGLLLAVLQTAAAQVFPVDQVRPGQKGKGRTVFADTKVEEFDVEILGVLANTSAKRNVILAKLGGRSLETTGVIQGMSGSPVYIDGKIVGAVAFSFPFSKEPLAGITPIEEMLAIADKVRVPGPSTPKLPFSDRLSLDDLFEAHKDRLLSPAPSAADGRVAAPLPLPLTFGGFSPPIVEKARPFFTALGFRPMAVPGGAQTLPKTLSPDFTVRGGDPLVLQLVSGDLDVSALGTATYVDGSRVYAFGHPLYNLGPVDYGMAKASVIAVVPALDTSFKMATTGSLIGAFTQDRTSGALGEIGRMPKFIPLNVSLSGEDGKRREFKLRLVNDRLLTPLLTNMSLAQILGTEDRSLGDLSLELSGDVYLDTTPAQSVHLEDLFSGNLDAPVTDMAGLVTAVLYFLTNNEFKEVGIHRLDLNVRIAEEPRFASLERVWLDKYEASPGETILMKIFTRSFRGQTEVQEIPFLAPRLPAGADFQLVIADTASMQRVEAGQYRSQGIVPRSLAQLVRLLNSLRKNNRIYFKLIGPRPGLFLHNEEMPNLPPAMKSLFASPRAASSPPTEITVSTLAEYQMPVPYAFRGLAVVPLRIRK